MTSPPPARSSRRERFGKSIQRAYDKVVNKVQPISQPSSLHPGSSIASSTGGVSVSSTPSVVLGAQVGPSETLLRDYTSPGSPGWPTGSATVSDSVHTMRPETVFADRLKHTESAAISGLETALRILEKSAKAFPPLNSAVGGFIACLDIVQSAATNAEDYNQITQELITMADTLNNYVTDLGPEDSNNVAGRIARSIEVEVSRIEERRGRGKARRMIEAEDDKNDVIKCYRTIEGLFRQLHSDIAIRTWKNTNKLPLQHRMTLLQGMSPVDDARYNSSYSTTVKRRGCTPETREKVQADLQDWIRDPTGAKVYWMNGMAGTGKTTIAYSLCEWLEANKQLGASFFCSRVLSSCRNVNLIVPTIAYQLALTLQGYQSTLCQILEAHPGVSKLNVARQFEKLIQEPLLARKGIIPEGVVVVIDALDECEDEYGLRLMIGTLLKLAGNLTLKFFVTSRPEPAIRDNMMSIGGFSPAILHLHDIEESIVEGDIKKYLDDEFGPTSLAPSKIDQLAKRAGNLFIYAATAARYILSGRGDPIDRLDAMLAMDSGSKYTDQYSKKYDEIDGLYTTILEAAISDEGLERVEVDRMQQVLWTVVCAKEPLTISALASLAGLAETQVRSSLKPLYSVLHVSSNRGLVSTLHASFPNFLFNPRRSQKQHCDESQHNMLLAHRCFDIMKNELKFNICGLKSSYEFDRDVPDLDHRIETCISSSLSYACQYWGEHLRSSRASDGLITMLVDFLGYRLLFWMEVLNLKKCVAKGIVALVNAQQWISASKSPSTTQQLAGDARDFVSRFAAGACSRSTPHIYISALPFCAKSGPIYAHYWGRTRGLMDMGGTAISQRDRAALATWKTSSTVLSVVFSPNSTSIASGSADGTVRVWDAYTGNVTAGPIEAHSASVYSVSFSPDSASVASASKDKTVRVWNTRTGELTAGPFVGHTSHVRSVAFSPDGARIVSGSDDQTIRVWDACTGDLVVQPFQGHTHHVNSVSFSPDGTLVVSGSHDMTVRVWDARTGGTAAEPFTGHTGPVRSVAFSPDGTSIASGSDDHSIRLWNTLNGDVVAGPFKGHTKGINSVLFSPDGLHIASGASDMTVQVWSVSTGISVGQINGHAGAVFSVAFSPDGAHIATGSGDLTIRVWNAHTPGFDTSLFESGHAQLVTSLSFSPDGTRIITGSGDHTIRLWDTHTGSLVAKPLVGHTGWISSVAFSRDGRRIVSGSEDTTLRVWDAQTGEIVGNPLKGHERWVMSVAFSPDSTLVVSGSQDQTIRLWDARKGDTVAGPLRGHTDNVNSVAFSPDGTLIVSGSDDMTILVWNIATGEVVVGPIEDHTNSVKSVAFSFDGTHIVSGSQDRTIRLWDARTGDSMAPPFRGHQGFVNSVAFSPDDALIVSGSDDKTIRVWDAQTGDVVAGPLRSHTGEINSVAFSPDGIHIASGSSDQAIRISYYRPYNANNRPYFQSPDPSSTAPSNDTSDAPELDYSVSPDKASTSTLGTTPISSQHRVQGTSNAAGFQCHDDGWITSGGVALFWTPPDLRTHIPFPQDKLVMGHQGSLFINYDNLLLGEQWVECYNSSLSMF